MGGSEKSMIKAGNDNKTKKRKKYSYAFLKNY